jgi:hypothetical protein
MGASVNGGYHQMEGFIMKNPKMKWMRTGGSPVTQETSIDIWHSSPLLMVYVG